MPNFPYTRESTVARWSNYHGTIKNHAIPLVLVPDLPGEIDATAPSKYKRCGTALKQIVAYALANDKTIRVTGARWSLSNIIEPGDILIDSAYLNKMLRLGNAYLTDHYKQNRSPKGCVPVFAQSGTTIHTLNRALGDAGLALPTTGASDGHRIAGALATGTHGSAIDFGAVHDAVLGVHLIVAGDKALFVVPKKLERRAIKDELADWLTEQTGIKTDMLPDDAAFAAAQVSLGSLGVVHGVVLESVKLFGLRQELIPVDFRSPVLREAMRTLNTTPLHPHRPKRPFHFEVVASPYPPPGGGAWVRVMWKEDAEPPPISPPPADPELSVDLFNIIGAMNGAISGPIGGLAIEAVVNQILRSRFKPRADAARFPGEIFGPTTLPPGQGTSTEIAVSHANALATLDALMAALRAEATQGRHHLGALGIRFTPRGTGALLGMGQNAMTMHVEMGSVVTPDSAQIFDRCWRALDQANIPFACHWGQQGGFSPGRVQAYYGANAQSWRNARSAMLTAKARTVFASKILAPAGL